MLRDELVFQYSAGAKFVALAYLRGGWAAVNELLAHPPTSTEQVLWPDKYFVHRNVPTLVRLGGLEAYRKPQEWTVMEENTIGALTVRILVEAFLDPTRAERVASGLGRRPLHRIRQGGCAAHLLGLGLGRRGGGSRVLRRRAGDSRTQVPRVDGGGSGRSHLGDRPGPVLARTTRRQGRRRARRACRRGGQAHGWVVDEHDVRPRACPDEPRSRRRRSRGEERIPVAPGSSLRGELQQMSVDGLLGDDVKRRVDVLVQSRDDLRDRV